jgi:hypothetical protein
VKKRKTTIQILNSKTCTSWLQKLPKIHKNFDCSSQAPNITNKLLRIARKNSNKTVVFTISKNFMAQDKHQKISKKYSKLTI